MSLLSSVIIPKIENELVVLEPAITRFIFSQLKSIGLALLEHVENKINSKKDELQ